MELSILKLYKLTTESYNQLKMQQAAKEEFCALGCSHFLVLLRTLVAAFWLWRLKLEAFQG